MEKLAFRYRIALLRPTGDPEIKVWKISILSQDAKITKDLITSSPLYPGGMFKGWEFRICNSVEVKIDYKRIFLIGTSGMKRNSNSFYASQQQVEGLKEALEEFRTKFCGQEEKMSFHRLTTLFVT